MGTPAGSRIRIESRRYRWPCTKWNLRKIRQEEAVLYDVLGGNELVYTGVLHERRQLVSRGASQGNRAVVPNRYTSVGQPEARSHIVVANLVKGW